MKQSFFTSAALTLIFSTITLTAATPVVVPARLISQTNPSYPAQARQARLEGNVAFNITIARDGSVREIQLVSGHPMLVPAAREAVSKWRYQPTMLDGRAIDMSTRVEIRFALTR